MQFSFLQGTTPKTKNPWNKFHGRNVLEIHVILCWLIAALLFLSGKRADAAGYDWPQYAGLNRNGVSKETGLQKSWKTDWFVNAALPQFVLDDKIFISSSYDHGAALLRARTTAGKVGVEEVWLSRMLHPSLQQPGRSIRKNRELKS